MPAGYRFTLLGRQVQVERQFRPVAQSNADIFLDDDIVNDLMASFALGKGWHLAPSAARVKEKRDG
jgi:hypothetical protein